MITKKSDECIAAEIQRHIDSAITKAEELRKRGYVSYLKSYETDDGLFNIVFSAERTVRLLPKGEMA